MEKYLAIRLFALKFTESKVPSQKEITLKTEEKLVQNTISLSANIKLKINPHNPERDSSILKTLEKEIQSTLNTFKASGDIESFTTKNRQTLKYETVKKQAKKRQKLHFVTLAE